MSGRRRRFETSWDDMEEKRSSADIYSNISPRRSQKWSKSEDHDDLMHGNFSRSPSWDHLHGNRTGPKDDNIRRDRNRMYSHQTFDKWEKPYNTHPSDDSYGHPYRSRDKEVGGNGRMSREPERERTRSPIGSRSRSRDGWSRSSGEGTRGHRHETNSSYSNVRNNSKEFASRDGGNNRTESWSRRTDYKDGSRYNDYPHRNVSDDYRNTRIPCRFFAAGNCSRDNCRFSHDVPETSRGYDDNRNLGNKNGTWRDDQQPHDNLNARSRLAEMDKKYRSSWDDGKSIGFDEISHQRHTLDQNNNKKNTSWDSWDDKKTSLDGHVSQDASGVHDTAKSHSNLDNKKISWNGPTSWDDASGSGFSSVSIPCHKYEESGKESLIDSSTKDRMSAKSGSDIDRNITMKWDGPLWDEFREPETTDNSKITMWEGPGSNKMASDNSEVVANDSDLNNIVPEDAKQQVLTFSQDLMRSVHDMNSQSLSYINGSDQSSMLSSNPFNGPSNGQVQGMHEGGKPLIPVEVDAQQPQVTNDANQTSLTSQLAPEANALPAVTSHEAQLSHVYTELNISNAINYLKSLPNSAYNQDARAKEEQNPVTNTEILSSSVTQQNQMPAELAHDSIQLRGVGVEEKEAVEGIDKRVAENGKKQEPNTNGDNPEAQGKAEEGDTGNDEKAMRQFKIGLVEFVKDILKPKWKEGKMSRDVHKAVVKKVVEKVTSSIQGAQIPRTQPKIEQYLAHSKPKITKLVEAYVERLQKA